jgi:hypothetical protein
MTLYPITSAEWYRNVRTVGVYSVQTYYRTFSWYKNADCHYKKTKDFKKVSEIITMAVAETPTETASAKNESPEALTLITRDHEFRL